MEFESLGCQFAALAMPRRLEVLELLVAAGAGGLAAGEIARRLGTPPSSLSFHLSALADAGIASTIRRGRETHYTVRPGGLREVLAFLVTIETGGDRSCSGDFLGQLPAVSQSAWTMTPAYNVAFICTRNSARSIMAEAILEKIGNGRFRAYSAGTDPADAPMPEVIERLAMLGHDVSRLRSKHWRDLTGPDAPRMDFVLTLCDLEQGEACPEFGDEPVTAAWPFPDPAKFVGSPAEGTTLLNELYGMIRRRLEAFIALPFTSLDEIAMKTRLMNLANGSPYRA